MSKTLNRPQLLDKLRYLGLELEFVPKSLQLIPDIDS